MADHDDNIFDEDDALDYFIYNDAEKNTSGQKQGNGCFGILLLLLIPVWLVTGF